MPAGTGVGTVRAEPSFEDTTGFTLYRLIYNDNKTLSAFDFIDYLTVIIYDFYPSGEFVGIIVSLINYSGFA